ncbi:MAG: TolC family protein [Deltaproteobacteria bacterium]|nr:TolC family protein [Deltaproteobacteria bacterium]
MKQTFRRTTQQPCCPTTSSWLSWLLVLVALFLPPPAHARSLTLDQAVSLALRKSVKVAKSRQLLRQVDAKRKSVRGNLLPQLSVEGNLLYWDDDVAFDFGLDKLQIAPGCEQTAACMLPLLTAFDFGPIREQITAQLTVQIAQPITPLYQIFKGYQAAKLGAQAARVGVRLSAQQVADAARQAYIRVKQAQGSVSIAQAAVKQVQAQLKTVKAFRRAGLSSRNDVLKVQVGLARAQGAAVQAKAGLELATAALAIEIGLPPSEEIEPRERFADPPPSFELTFGACIERAAKRRPELKAVALQKRIAEKSSEATRGAMLPQLSAIGSYQRTEGQGFAMPKNAFFVGGVLSWKFTWGTSYYAYREAQEKVVNAELTQRQARDGVYLDVKKAYLELKTAEQQLFIARVAVKQAEESYRIEEAKYKKSSATTTDVLDAQLSLSRSKLSYNNALYGWYLSHSALGRAMGEEPMTGRTL